MHGHTSCAFIVPGSLETRTGGYEYDRRIIGGLRALGWTVDVREIDGSFPFPSSESLARAGCVFASIRQGTVVVDGLALGAMPAVVEAAADRLRIIALMHLPLADEVGLSQHAASRLAASEQRAVLAATGIVATGHAAVETLTTEYGVDRRRIALVEPGTDPAPVARGSGGPEVHLVCVAAVTPGKGHEHLIRALGPLRDRQWRLTCAGSLDRDPRTVDRVRRIIADEELEGHITFAGELDAADVADLYDRADAFVLATLRETYGMAVAEALARGVPVVSTSTGAIPALIGDADDAAGIVGRPGDVDGLRRAISVIVSDADARARFAAGARRARERLPSWDDAARRMARALDNFGPR